MAHDGHNAAISCSSPFVAHIKQYFPRSGFDINLYFEICLHKNGNLYIYGLCVIYGIDFTKFVEISLQSFSP